MSEIVDGYKHTTSMEIHFWESYLEMPADIPFVSGWHETEELINARAECINTMQMGLLSTRLAEYGYRIFVHPYHEKSYEIRVGIGVTNECTDKEIRPAHNLFRMWEAGAFHVE